VISEGKGITGSVLLIILIRTFSPCEKVLPFEKVQINLAFCSLIRTFSPCEKVLPFEKVQINLAFCSLIRTFVIVKHLLSIIVLLAALCCCTTEAERRQMRAGLDSINVLNRTDQPFTPDDVRPYIDFFDKEAKAFFTLLSSDSIHNDQLLAHYLLGRAYHEKGDAPMALESYQHAIDHADTTSASCDYKQLSRVYAQMAELFFQQGLYKEQLRNIKLSVEYAWKGKDTISALMNYEQAGFAYDKLGLKDSSIYIIEDVARLYYKFGYPSDAAISLGTIAQILMEKGEYVKAKHYMDLYETESGFFDKEGNIDKGRERFYGVKGYYYFQAGLLDSAEYWYRKELQTGRDYNNQNSGACGLSSVYRQRHLSDSVAKYASYAYAMNDSMYANKATETIERMRSMHNYSRHQEIAKRESERAEEEKDRRERITLLLLVIIALSSFVIYRIYAVKNEKQKLYLQTLDQYEQTHLEVMQLREHADEYNTIINEKAEEIETLKNEVNAQRDVKTKILERENQIKQLRERVKGYEESISEKQTTIETLKNKLNEYQEKRSSNYEQQESTIKESDVYSKLLEKQNKSKLNQKELKECRRLVLENLPEFEDLLLSGQYHLRELDFNVCMLLRFGFKSKEISILLGISQPRVSQICVKVLRVVFEKDSGGATDLTHLLYQLH